VLFPDVIYEQNAPVLPAVFCPLLVPFDTWAMPPPVAFIPSVISAIAQMRIWRWGHLARSVGAERLAL